MINMKTRMEEIGIVIDNIEDQEIGKEEIIRIEEILKIEEVVIVKMIIKKKILILNKEDKLKKLDNTTEKKQIRWKMLYKKE